MGRPENKEISKRRRRRYEQEYRKQPGYKEKMAKYQRERRKNNPKARISDLIRRRLTEVRKGRKKSNSTIKSVGCSWDFLKEFIENQWLEGMSWENFGLWHLDHFIPLNLAETEEQLEILSHFINLRPLWAIDNLKRPKDGSDVLMARDLPSKVNLTKSFSGLEGYEKGGVLAKGGDDHTVPVKDSSGQIKGVAGLKTGEIVFTIESIIGAGNGDYDKGLKYLLAYHRKLDEIGKAFLQKKNSLSAYKGPTS